MPVKDDPIEHIVVLMLENASFDRLLGCKKRTYPKLEGVDESSPKSNPDFESTNVFFQQPTKSRVVRLDPEHEVPNVLRQLADDGQGFVADYAQTYPQSKSEERQEIMGYYALGALPVLHSLAAKYLICDRWFSSLPGPTWANRFFVHSGTALGHIKMPNGVFNPNFHIYNQETIYNQLSEKGIRWGIYYGDFPQSMVMEKQWPLARHYHKMEQFFKDAQGPADTFPQYSFIEPSYFGVAQDDQHPPSDIYHGEHLLARVYEALVQNSDLWKSTLMIIVYDEHGGFYDHVPPPATIAPDSHTQEYSFDRYGVRVPALLISPWVDATFDSTTFDHTSILKYVCGKWSIDPAVLGQRVARANSILPLLLKRDLPRDDVPMVVREEAIPNEQQNDLNANQKSLLSFSRYVEMKLNEEAGESLEAIGMRAVQAAGDLWSAGEIAVQRIEKFINLMR